MKFKTLSMVVSSALALGLLGCTSTPQTNNATATSNNNTFAVSKARCQAFKVPFSVSLTEKDFNGKTTNLACYGQDGVGCKLRIYQIMVESFYHSDKGTPGYTFAWGPSKHNGNIKGITEKLDYIKSTGANAIWFTPIFVSTPFENQDHNADKLDGTGYFTSDYFTIDPKFGTKEELKELVEKAHQKGLYVFMDGVLGHAKANIKLTSPKGNSLVTNIRCRDAWGQIDKVNKSFWCFDTEKSMDFYKELLTYWIKEVKIDGWRFDQMYQLEPKYWKELNKTIADAASKVTYNFAGKKVKALGYTVGEMWTDQPRSLSKNAFDDQNMNSAFNFPMRYQLMKVIATNDDVFAKDACGQPASSLATAYDAMKGYPKTAMPNTIVSNHDYVRLGDLIQRAGYSKDGEKDANYFARHKAAYSFIAATSGPLTMYYNDEIGAELEGFVEQPGNCGDVCRCDDHVGRTDGKFDNLTAGEQDLKNYIAKIFNLRDQYPSLAIGNRTHVYSNENIFIDLKSYKDEKILYVLNVSEGEGNVSIDPSLWTKLVGKGTVTLTDLVTNEKISGDEIKVNGLSGNFYKIN